MSGAKQKNADVSATEMSPLTDSVQAGGDEQLQLVTFEVAGEEFAVDILAVREINRMMQITQVPQSTADVEGVINLRGRIVPVVDLRTRLGLERAEGSRDNRIIVVEVDRRTVGFVVDRVKQVLRIDSRVVEQTPELSSTADAQYIDGVGKLDDRLIILLNLQRLFGGMDTQQVEDAAQTDNASASNTHAA